MFYGHEPTAFCSFFMRGLLYEFRQPLERPGAK